MCRAPYLLNSISHLRDHFLFAQQEGGQVGRALSVCHFEFLVLNFESLEGSTHLEFAQVLEFRLTQG